MIVLITEILFGLLAIATLVTSFFNREAAVGGLIVLVLFWVVIQMLMRALAAFDFLLFAIKTSRLDKK